ncbi:MAG: glycoside hydrolase family 5 protein [Firmicutes bacterium]|nr:glycoside hydrolase family 5 protein [Bacillota bacterium]
MEPSLRFGTNVSHWLSQSNLDRNHLASFFTEADVARIASWGMDHLRLPVDYGLFEHEGAPAWFSEEGLSWIDRAVEWTGRAGLYLVLDLHCLPGHSFMTADHNPIWPKDSPYRRRAVAIWEMLAGRYRGAEHVLLEILNEPVAKDDEDWNELAAELHAAIRRRNGESWVVIPSNRWDHPRTFASLRSIPDERVIYTFHFYEPFLFTHQNAPWVPQLGWLAGRKVPYPGPLPPEIVEAAPADRLTAPEAEEHRRAFARMAREPYGPAYLEEILRPVLAFRQKTRAMVYCGEFGVIAEAPAADRLRWYADLTALLRRHGIAMANWDYKSDNFGLVDRAGHVHEELLAALRGDAG